jgi:proline iminopeptidase
MSHRPGRLVDVWGTKLYVVEVGDTRDYPILIFHGGPGFDHHEFADYLDPLTERGYRLVFVDERAQGRSAPAPPESWTLHQMAADVTVLAGSLGLERYATLGHSYGAFVVLQNAVDFPGMAAQTIVSGGVPSAGYLDVVEKNLASFEPAGLRQRVAASWERETSVQTPEEMDQLWLDQSPFHFADPLDPRIDEYNAKSTLVAGAVYSPAVLRHFAAQDYGQIEVEDRLGEIARPVLVLAGRHDRVCSVEAAEAMARGIPNSELVVFEESGHMTFVEETAKYLDVVDGFLSRHRS